MPLKLCSHSPLHQAFSWIDLIQEQGILRVMFKALLLLTCLYVVKVSALHSLRQHQGEVATWLHPPLLQQLQSMTEAAL